MQPTTRIQRLNRWRLLGWGSVAALLLLPFLAMQAGSRAVNWTVGDFVFAAIMIGTVGLAFEMVVRRSASGFYRGGGALALLTGFLLLWVNVAVGYLGNEDNPANWLLVGVVAVGLLGAISVGFDAQGMVSAMTVTAIVHGVVVALAMLGRLGTEPGEWPLVGTATAMFVAMWLVSALLFRRAARSV